ncbi:Rne/Rng family ribonuclease [Candidatus Babeliales bacterium]|nr:Rne/Rng family ribonuclease [Candidatus Babeliales bacterium]
MAKKILINNELWQTRVALLNDNKLQDIYFDTKSKEDLERCYFKGRITKVLPGIQTAFVDIGHSKSGFLHITEVDRSLATEKISEFLQLEDEEELSKRELKSSLDISKIFTEGEDVLVQVIKEPIHEKGAKLTTCFTLPGKFVVLMPNIPQIGVSKKIEDRDERTRLKEIVAQCVPEGMGAIARTTAEGRLQKAIEKDIEVLISTWKSVQKKFAKAKPGEKIHEDLSLSLRTVRDHLDDDVEAIITDDKQDQEKIINVVKALTPEFADRIRFYGDHPPLFDKFDIEKQIEKALQKKVQLKSGGSLIIESTEAMTVVDVNTGKFTGSNNMEDTILRTNLEAAEEIATQLRLRNIGGLIVIDFIDMANQGNRQKLSRHFEKMLHERDKYQSVTLKVSEFGIIQMTRKRSGKTLVQQLMHVCQTCHGSGAVKSTSTLSFELLQEFSKDVVRKGMKDSIVLSIPLKVFDYLIHHEYKSILQLEKRLGVKIVLESNEDLEGNHFQINKV